jgi:hypothetical protein
MEKKHSEVILNQNRPRILYEIKDMPTSMMVDKRLCDRVSPAIFKCTNGKYNRFFKAYGYGHMAELVNIEYIVYPKKYRGITIGLRDCHYMSWHEFFKFIMPDNDRWDWWRWNIKKAPTQK